MYSPKDYWTHLAERYHSVDVSGFAPVLHPSAPTWFNKVIDDVQSRALRRALAIAELSPGARFLDVGCGTGRWLRRYGQLGFSPVGVDATHGMLRVARDLRTTCPLVAGLAYNLPFSDDVFDCLSDITVVQHIPRELQANALQEMIRVLRPGGRLILLELIRGRDSHIFPRQPEDWIHEVESCGATLIDWFGEEFFFPDRFFVRLAQAIFRRRDHLADQAQSASPGSSSAEYSLARRVYWHVRRITVAFSAWSEPTVAKICPASVATHAIFVFRKKP
jgi:ubiquinone/menaquinone biosynthesis C-methylase UbiE